MRFVAVLNRDGGTLRTTDLDAFSAAMTETLEAAGHSVEIEIVPGKRIEAALDRAVKTECDVVLVGGGDGSISAAASRLTGKDKALAVLPAGTMNLFARSLGVPLTLEAAVSGFADGEVRSVDVGSANGDPFIHQFSIGMHARMIHLREKMEFASRWGKMRASLRATWTAFSNPKVLRARLILDDAVIETRATGIGITNNLWGEGQLLPYAARPDGGVLGVYITVARERMDIIKLVWHMLRGRWKENDQVEIHECDRVTLEVPRGRGRPKCAVDGELVPLQERTEIRIHPGALKVLVPRAAGEAKAA